MWTISRRTAVKSLLGVPLAAAVAKYPLYASVIPPDAGSDYERKFLAVRILRLVNSVQLFHLDSQGHYSNLSELGKLESADRWLDSKGAEEARIGRLLYSKLHLGEDEIVPGWKIKYRLRNDKPLYSVVLKDISAEHLGAFATDQSGVIYEGTHIGTDVSDVDWQPADALILGSPIEAGHGKQGKYTALLHKVAFGPTEPCCGGCCPGCSCFGPNQGVPGCRDCGCPCCVWCCCFL